MARGLNKVMLIGHIQPNDPELRYTQSGQPLCTFKLVTDESYKDREGNMVERSEWHNIVVWGKQAETCGQYLAKGRQVYVEGSIRTRSYDDKTGTKRYVTEIVAQRIRFLGGGGGTRVAPEMDQGGSEDMGGGGGVPPMDDDIPF